MLRISCPYRSLGPQLPFGRLLVVFLFVFLSPGFLCLRHAGTLCHAGGAGKSVEQNYAQAGPPDRPRARQEIRSIFGKISPLFLTRIIESPNNS